MNIRMLIKHVFILLFSLLMIRVQAGAFIYSEGTYVRGTKSLPSVKNESPDTSLLNEQIRKVWLYLNNKDIHKARENMDVAYSIVKKHKLKIPFSLFWVNAEVCFEKKEYSEALWNAEKALSLLYSTDKTQDYIKVAILKNKILRYSGKFSDSKTFLESQIEYSQERKIKGFFPCLYREMAILQNLLGDTAGERKYHQLTLESSIKENNEELKVVALFSLADISLRIDSNIVESTQKFREALKISESRKDSLTIPLIISRIAWNYYLLKEYTRSVEWYNKCIENGLQIHDNMIIANAFGNIGTIYRDQNKYSKALYFYEKSTAFALKQKDWYTLSWVYNDMSNLYVRAGDYKKAYESHVLYKRYNDLLESNKFKERIAEARIRYEMDAKKKELEVLSLKLEKQQFFAWGSAIIIALFSLIGLLLFRQVVINNKRRISEMNRKISEITQANLRQQMNPHFIFNTLNSIQYYMYQHDKIATNIYLTKFSSLMRKTLENSQHTAITLKDELDALELYLELETLRFKEKFNYEIVIDEEIDPLLYKIPTMIIQPYVENAICHGLINQDKTGNLKISVSYCSDHLLCVVEDNGIGREAAQKIKHSKSQNHNSLGTRITESRIDLANNAYGTQMKVHFTDLTNDLGEACGTRVEIQIPIMT